MREHPIRGAFHHLAREGLERSPLFKTLTPNDREIVLTHATLHEFSPNEVIITEGEVADSFFLVLRGQAAVTVQISPVESPIELNQISAPNIFGEMALLLQNPRSATVVATGNTVVLRFLQAAFELMLDGIQGFGRQLSTSLAVRLAQTSRRVPLQEIEKEQLGSIDGKTLRLLPSPFILRHRVMPLQFQNNLLTLGCVDDPTPTVFQTIQRIVPGCQIRPFRISYDTFTHALRSHGMLDRASSSEVVLPQDPPIIVGVLPSQEELPVPQTTIEVQAQIAKIRPLLQRVVAEGASDLYLSAQQKPRWKIGHRLYTIEDYRELRPLEAFHLLSGLLPQPRLKQFEEQHHTDFSCTVRDLARFRVNLFRSEQGVNAVLRHIPLSPPNLEQLQFPPPLLSITQLREGLVLFSGPPGSGKTTTIAALVNAINHTRRVHVLTLEDPIEYVHSSHQALVHQREVGSHVLSMTQGLKAAMRETPNVLVVGDLDNTNTIKLVLEAARSGCLILCATQSRGAARTILRLLEQFPVDEQPYIRRALGEVLRCVVSQELCHHNKGGRVAAFEFMSMDPDTAKLLREDNLTAMIEQLTKRPGNMTIHHHLARLIQTGQISIEEGHAHAIDHKTLDAHLKTPPPPHPTPQTPSQT